LYFYTALSVRAKNKYVKERQTETDGRKNQTDIRTSRTLLINIELMAYSRLTVES